MIQLQKHRYTAGIVVVLLAVGLVGTAVAPAAATHDEDDDASTFDTLFTESDDGVIDQFLAVAGGMTDRALYASPFGPDPSTAEESAVDAMETFNEHSEDFVQYANDRGVHHGETVTIRFVQNDEHADIVIVADYNETSERYESAEAVTAETFEDEHDMEISDADELVCVRGMAADKAADELEAFHAEFASDGEDVTKSYMRGMAATYGPTGLRGPLVESTLLDDVEWEDKP